MEGIDIFMVVEEGCLETTDCDGCDGGDIGVPSVDGWSAASAVVSSAFASPSLLGVGVTVTPEAVSAIVSAAVTAAVLCAAGLSDLEGTSIEALGLSLRCWTAFANRSWSLEFGLLPRDEVRDTPTRE